jgi:hypothetical protein
MAQQRLLLRQWLPGLRSLGWQAKAQGISPFCTRRITLHVTCTHSFLHVLAPRWKFQHHNCLYLSAVTEQQQLLADCDSSITDSNSSRC